MTYGLAFSLFSRVQGRARPNLTGRLLKERGERCVPIVNSGTSAALPRADATREPMLYSTSATRERDACMGGYVYARARNQRIREAR